MDNYKGYGSSRSRKGTRPFMPVHDRPRNHAPHEDDVMQVGVEAMIDESDRNHVDAAENGQAATRDELAALREERDNYLDLARRERADFDNYRKRVERDMREIKRQSLANFLKEFFGPLDDMERVLNESLKTRSYDDLFTGVRIVEENFWRVLAKVGIKKIDAKGKPFDPALHEAMAAVPSADVPPNTVIEVYDNGYKLDDFILRPAKVVVSKAVEE